MMTVTDLVEELYREAEALRRDIAALEDDLGPNPLLEQEEYLHELRSELLIRFFRINAAWLRPLYQCHPCIDRVVQYRYPKNPNGRLSLVVRYLPDVPRSASIDRTFTNFIHDIEWFVTSGVFQKAFDLICEEFREAVGVSLGRDGLQFVEFGDILPYLPCPPRPRGWGVLKRTGPPRR